MFWSINYLKDLQDVLINQGHANSIYEVYRKELVEVHEDEKFDVKYYTPDPGPGIKFNSKDTSIIWE